MRHESIDLNVAQDSHSFLQRRGDQLEFVFDDRPTKKATMSSYTQVCSLFHHLTDHLDRWCETRPCDSRVGTGRGGPSVGRQ